MYMCRKNILFGTCTCGSFFLHTRLLGAPCPKHRLCKIPLYLDKNMSALHLKKKKKEHERPQYLLRFLRCTQQNIPAWGLGPGCIEAMSILVLLVENFILLSISSDAHIHKWKLYRLLSRLGPAGRPSSLLHTTFTTPTVISSLGTRNLYLSILAFSDCSFPAVGTLVSVGRVA